MTNEEMKQALAQGGIATADIEKISDNFDAERISQLVEAASSPESAFRAIHEFYPELEVEALQKQCDFVMEQVEAAMKEQKKSEAVELTEDELENVAGGGWFSDVGSWFKKNWKAVAVGAAIVVGAALICTGVGAGIGAVITSVSAQAFIYGGVVGTSAAIGAGVGAAVGGVVTGALAGTGNLPG